MAEWQQERGIGSSVYHHSWSHSLLLPLGPCTTSPHPLPLTCLLWQESPWHKWERYSLPSSIPGSALRSVLPKCLSQLPMTALWMSAPAEEVWWWWAISIGLGQVGTLSCLPLSSLPLSYFSICLLWGWLLIIPLHKKCPYKNTWLVGWQITCLWQSWWALTIVNSLMLCFINTKPQTVEEISKESTNKPVASSQFPNNREHNSMWLGKWQHRLWNVSVFLLVAHMATYLNWSLAMLLFILGTDGD